jgi:hypothetical protein
VKIILIFIISLIVTAVTFSQENPLERFDYLIGDWSGVGSGFGNDKSKIESSFQYIMNRKYIEITNDSKFEPTEKNPEGEHHIDKGYISYDKARDLIICRQFFIEGYVIQFFQDDILSNDTTIVFVSEHIENLSGGKARWTIKKKSETEFEDTFEVSFPGKEFMCLGTNNLKKKK